VVIVADKRALVANASEAGSGRSTTGRGPAGTTTAGITTAAISTAAIGPAVGSPTGIGRHAAQQLARRELSKAIYQPSLYQRFLNWLSRRIGGVSATVPGGWWALIALIVAAVLVISLVIFWIRPARTRRAVPGAVLTGRQLSARDHRQNAERLAAAGDYSAAIIESTRAIAVGLEERGVLPPKPGRTADELAAESGRALPGQAAELAGAARLFDDVMYGGRDGQEPGYRRVRELDARLRDARPAGAIAVHTAGTVTGVRS
jgi:hypothetical protein